MKKAFVCILAMILLAQISFAQKNPKQAIDQTIAEKGDNLFMNIDKTLLEPNESARLSIGMLVYKEQDFIPGDETPPLVPPDEEILPPENNLYRATNWKIVQGGGTLISIDDTTQTYTAPPKMPPDKIAVVSVDLVPKMPTLPKVVLVQTIYLAENETAFVLNMPALGILNNKYGSKLNSGTKIPTISPQAAKNLPPGARQKLEQAKKQMEQQSIDMDLTAMTSNAFAYYEKAKGFTAVSFNELGLQMLSGKTNAAPSKDAMLNFNFNGSGVGTYKIGEEKTGLGFFLFKQQKAFGCGDTQSDTEKLPCAGNINITEVDAKFIKGTVRVSVFTSVGKKIYRGNFYGKFKVNRAN